MRVMNHFVSLGFILMTCVPSSVAQDAVSSVFTVRHETAVPGSLLKAGIYTIQVIDHLNDRSVVQITSNSKPNVTFLAVGSINGLQGSVAGPVTWNKKLNGVEALRGYNFPTGQRLDFVYPKNDGVVLANVNRESVVAVDPASENRPELSKLSPADLQLVNLWSLTPVKVGPADASTDGIEAKRYSVPQGTGLPTPTSSAALTASENPSTTQPAVVAELHKPKLYPEPVQRRVVVKRLPQTASYTPLLALLSVLFLGAAVWMRRQRQSAV